MRTEQMLYINGMNGMPQPDPATVVQMEARIGPFMNVFGWMWGQISFRCYVNLMKINNIYLEYIFTVSEYNRNTNLNLI